MKVQLLRAWPRRFEQVTVELPPGARVADALRAAGWELVEGGEVGYAVFGVVATVETALHDGDRVELLRPLLVDPKQARRRRAASRAR
ncbi:hypothetical protein N799_11315 [Lysobacter arseniciresistens ZS79]|uniref:UPF0125 protein N799_11315 n=1 Tax=Lysobacter arseniciresistens ZS79 TaxID=913325 RepID=A0A0A0ETK1_9GAMM|nr:RnfH family protein [Lysobacter arseniciresistens]KGM53580.1 hypothetical protein N799_11315 [Lysobacter arseniciresistens ZS79]